MLTRELERAGIPVAFITAMTMVGKQFGANRIVTAAKIPHPCGDPGLPEESDRALRREIVRSGLRALKTDVSDPTIFMPDVKYAAG